MELSFLYSLQALHNPALDKVMIFFTNLGEYGAVWILTAILLLCFQKYRRYGALMLVSLLVTFLIGEIGLKNLIMRERPLVADPTVQQLIPLPSGSSFPSGHTASSFTAAWILWKADRKFGAAGLALAVCIGFSRLYLFVHYPTDVLGGAVLGIACAQGIYLLAKRYMRKSKILPMIFHKRCLTFDIIISGTLRWNVM